ncbi:helix-turn-helix domain-containing protein [Alteromonas sp. 009811495]|jgi:transcriptional regulator with XRE-family HTH domain|uniref:helix-turn-helix domain-containing protein n=1 Tax=Alteromonas sp. 009811495 TaxID=3002962 RepID=UPI00237EBBEE|nr:MULTISPECIES: helix-turn-helix transcriptional regulator [Alteromonas]WDT84711.1 helix-turn-helix transcriptional regulator [Alteromonas sp. 009811495]|tara:strand:- start:7180 stop:7443 length:264 start_codon:yes stop_codon:yes gene_type:complete
MNNDESPFPRRLKQARKDRGLSQKQLGILSGMDEFSASARMNQYEKGVHSPDFKTVKALAEVLKVPTAFLYCEEDDLAEQIASFKNG